MYSDKSLKFFTDLNIAIFKKDPFNQSEEKMMFIEEEIKEEFKHEEPILKARILKDIE